MGQTLTLSRPPEARSPEAADRSGERPGSRDAVESISGPAPSPGRPSRRISADGRQRLSAILSRLSRQDYSPETPQIVPNRARPKRSPSSFGLAPTDRVEELDPMPFIVDERCVPEGLRWPEVAIDHPAGRLGSDDKSGRLVRARILEITLGAVALRWPRPIAPGTLLNLLLPTGGGSGVSVKAEVVRSEPGRESGIIVVCRLGRPLTLSEIREIGRELFSSVLV